jgi:hypothetical protein
MEAGEKRTRIALVHERRKDKQARSKEQAGHVDGTGKR